MRWKGDMNKIWGLHVGAWDLVRRGFKELTGLCQGSDRGREFRTLENRFVFDAV